MAYLIARISLTVESADDEIKLKEKIEQAMNVACAFLGVETKEHEYISYNISGYSQMH